MEDRGDRRDEDSLPEGLARAAGDGQPQPQAEGLLPAQLKRVQAKRGKTTFQLGQLAPPLLADILQEEPTNTILYLLFAIKQCIVLFFFRSVRLYNTS